MYHSSLMTNHIGQAGSKLSPRIWSRLQNTALTPDGTAPGVEIFDDFANFGQAASGSDVSGGYAAYLDTGCTIKQTAESGGVIQFTADTDNEQASLITGGNSGSFGAISDTAGEDKLTLFEARVAFGQIGNTYNAFVGLGAPGDIGDSLPHTDVGAFAAATDLIGFSVLEADGDSLRFIHKKTGSATTTTVMTYGTALVADTWYNLGFVYDPKEPTSTRIKIFINNIEQTTYVTSTGIASATFPDGAQLAMLADIHAGGAAQTMKMDVWRCYQEG